jgi:hypothetical protein
MPSSLRLSLHPKERVSMGCTPSVRHQCRSEPWNAARNGHCPKVSQAAGDGECGMHPMHCTALRKRLQDNASHLKVVSLRDKLPS